MLTVEEASRILNLHPQTVYRKIKRGEIPCHYIGKTIRINEADLGRHSGPSRNTVLPESLQHLFWDTSRSTLTSSDDVVIERILDQGDLGAIRWLLENCARSDIISFLRTKGRRRLSNKSLNFWSAYFGQNIYQYTKSGAESALGEGRWR